MHQHAAFKHELLSRAAVALVYFGILATFAFVGMFAFAIWLLIY